MLIAERFMENARLYPEQVAIWCNEKTITYSALAMKSIGYCSLCMEQGVNQNDFVLAQMDNSIDSVALILSASMLGFCLVPVNPTLPFQHIIDMINELKIHFIAANETFFEKMACAGLDVGEECKILRLNDTRHFEKNEFAIQNDILLPENVKQRIQAITGEEMFFLALTSGLHGKTKYISLSQKNKIDRISMHVDAFSLSADDRILVSTPLYHSLAFRMTLIPLMLGGTAILMKTFSPHRWLDCIEDEKVTFTISVSTQLEKIEKLLSSPFAPDLSSLRCVVSSSALLEPHVKSGLIRKLKCDFCEMYGTSETSTASIIWFNKHSDKAHTVGQPICGVDITILDQNGRIVVNEVGEIAVRTKLIFNGYYHQDELTSGSINADGYFLTGDLGLLDADGYLQFIGRKDELIINKGINVYPIDIENCLLKWPEIEFCAAFMYPEENGGETLSVAIIPSEGAFVDEQAVLKYCNTRLPDYQRPEKIFFLHEKPLNPMGKLYKARIVDEIKLREMRTENERTKAYSDF